MIVLLDTSLLLLMAEKPVDLDRLVELVGRFDFAVPATVMAELRSMTAGTGRRSRLARSALSFASKQRQVDAAGEVDGSLVDLASKGGSAVATMDAELIGRLRGRGVPVLTLRGDRFALLGPEP
ncbi:MAG: DNA-binding protein [Nitrososphaerota archaeon]|nr:DNA-binding protein [Nitrososphaerota archaeon]